MKKETHSTSIGCLSLFFILLILKLSGVLILSWWWVLSPLWIMVAIPLLALFITVIYKIFE